MIDRFLKAKHWQLFLLTFGIPMIFQFVMMGSMISNNSTQAKPNLVMMFNYMKVFPLIMIIFIGVFLGWFWSVAIGLQKKVPANIKMKVKKFKVLFFIPLIYILIFMTFFSVAMVQLFESGSNKISFGSVSVSGLFAVILPLHLLSMFCIFYSFYFVAKTFKTVEIQREVKFGDFAGEFFLIWFYPIGIWIIQPKINTMIEE